MQPHRAQRRRVGQRLGRHLHKNRRQNRQCIVFHRHTGHLETRILIKQQSHSDGLPCIGRKVEPAVLHPGVQIRFVEQQVGIQSRVSTCGRRHPQLQCAPEFYSQSQFRGIGRHNHRGRKQCCSSRIGPHHLCIIVVVALFRLHAIVTRATAESVHGPARLIPIGELLRPRECRHPWAHLNNRRIAHRTVEVRRRHHHGICPSSRINNDTSVSHSHHRTVQQRTVPCIGQPGSVALRQRHHSLQSVAHTGVLRSRKADDGVAEVAHLDIVNPKVALRIVETGHKANIHRLSGKRTQVGIETVIVAVRKLRSLHIKHRILCQNSTIQTLHCHSQFSPIRTVHIICTPHPPAHSQPVGICRDGNRLRHYLFGCPTHTRGRMRMHRPFVPVAPRVVRPRVVAAGLRPAGKTVHEALVPRQVGHHAAVHHIDHSCHSVRPSDV